MSLIAYPLLVLSLTGSAAKAGFVGFARLLALAIFALPAGLAADHWSRRRLMIAAHATRAVAIATLATLVVLDQITYWFIPVVAFIEGAGGALFGAASAGAFKAVVPKSQLPAEAAPVAARGGAVGRAGPPLGGVLFGIARALPFVVHAFSYALSTVALLLMRTPFQEARERDGSPLRSRLAEGVRFLWHHPFLRTCAFLFGLANFIGPGLFLAILIIGKDQGLTGGKVGLLLSAFGACLLLGAFLSPVIRRLLPVRGLLLLELW